MRRITSCLRAGSGGSNAMVPFFSTPTGTVIRTASPASSRDYDKRVKASTTSGMIVESECD